MTKKFFMQLLAAMAMICMLPAAQAELVTFEVSATVSDVWDPSSTLGGSVSPGDVITGTYTFETTTPDSDPSPEIAYYVHSATATTGSFGFDLVAGGHSFKTDPLISDYSINIHDAPPGYGEGYHVSSGLQNQPLTNGAQVRDIMLDLYDPSGNALSSTLLSATPPELGNFQYRDLMISGDNAAGTDGFHVSAQLTSIRLPGAPADGLVTFRVTAMVSEVWDLGGALNGTVNNGDMITGTYRFDPRTPDADPAIEVGHYVHNPGSSDFGFDLTVGGHTLVTQPLNLQGEFAVYQADSAFGGPDDYIDVTSFGGNQPLATGTTVDDIFMHLSDPSGTALTSAALTDTPPNLAQWQIKDLGFSGMHTNGYDYYNVIATIVSIEVIDAGSSPIELSPAASTFDMAQRFDAALIFDAGLAPVIGLSGTLNGEVIDDKLGSCVAGAPNSQGRQSFVCTDFSYLLQPGTNILNVSAKLEDGTTVTNSVTWELLSY